MGFVVDRQILRIHHHVSVEKSMHFLLTLRGYVSFINMFKTWSSNYLHLYLFLPLNKRTDIFLPFIQWFNQTLMLKCCEAPKSRLDLLASAQCFRRRNQHQHEVLRCTAGIPSMHGSMWMSLLPKLGRSPWSPRGEAHPATVWPCGKNWEG